MNTSTVVKGRNGFDYDAVQINDNLYIVGKFIVIVEDGKCEETICLATKANVSKHAKPTYTNRKSVYCKNVYLCDVAQFGESDFRLANHANAVRHETERDAIISAVIRKFGSCDKRHLHAIETKTKG